ncbi:MAG: aminomethyl-transferring glycine dehydrogenase subunit GcvPB [Hyphomonadaceae bacterium]
MRYLPLTPDDRAEMLNVIGARSVDDFYADVPAAARLKAPIEGLPNFQGELAVERKLGAMARKNRAAGEGPFFVGCGAYKHHIPASVDHIIQRSEFLTTYTPYQPEIAQGTLQTLFEFQTQVAALTAMEVANASMYDGSTACAEAALMACRATRRKTVVLSGGLHPHYADTTRTVCEAAGYKVVQQSPAADGEAKVIDALEDDVACVIVQSPNVFGTVTDLSPVSEAAHEKGALMVSVFTEAVSLGMVKPPGEMGADIAVGEGQSIGVPLGFGGPYVGLFATRSKLIRQMPGRLCGETVDADGKRGFVLTLSTREQHIRRDKATSNICTNSGLCALAFSAHMTLLGDKGLTRLAQLNHEAACDLADALGKVKGVKVLTPRYFNEFAFRTPKPAKQVLAGRRRRRDRRRPRLAPVPVQPCRRRDHHLRDRVHDANRYRRLCRGPLGGAEMTMNSTGRPTSISAVDGEFPSETVSGSNGLLQHEDLIFEIGSTAKTGVDLPEPKGKADRLGGVARETPTGLPGLTEPEMIRHYVRLSQKNYAIDLGVFPLGSCTMKHNPRLNEKMARLPGFADVHPLQPQNTVQGALELINELADWLMKLTNMPAVAMSPKAGAHGELCGMLAIRAALYARGEGERRKRVLVPESAHGTNPATAVQCGFIVDEIAAAPDGRVDLEDLRAKLEDSSDVAGVMLTNPNTCGLFERDIKTIADMIHAAGGYFYCDGANFNAIVGRVRPGDLGVDAMHINLHKTFSTPHGGGGPGAGPTVLSEALAPFAPVPFIVKTDEGLKLIEHTGEGHAAESFGRMCAFHGQMGMFVRALAYMMSHGADGLRQVAEDAVLNANYVLAKLKPVMSPAFEGYCMHEALFSDAFLKGSGVETLDIAKGLIDEGYHPMTTYFPLVVHGAMLIEPTETESKVELDRFCDALASVARRGVQRDPSLKSAPHLAPARRLDETRAARSPRLRWEPPAREVKAAE